MKKKKNSENAVLTDAPEELIEETPLNSHPVEEVENAQTEIAAADEAEAKKSNPVAEFF